MTKSVLLDGESLTCDGLVAVVEGASTAVVPAESRVRVTRTHELARDLMRTRPVYGRTTGVGAQKSETVGVEDADHGFRLLASHAIAAGPEVTDKSAVATMVVRLNQLAAGGSGISPQLFDALEYAIADHCIPTIHRGGSIGTGDIAPLAELALGLCGHVRPRTGTITPAQLSPGDALAFMSSSALTLADAALITVELERLLAVTEVVAALTFCALQGSWECLAAEVHRARPHPAAAQCAEQMRALLGIGDDRPKPIAARLQDPFGLRAFTTVHGCAHEAVSQLRRVVEIDLNAATENPLVSLEAGEVFHHGNFHLAPVALAAQSAAAALFGTAKLSMARLSDLMESAQTGLPSFLTAGPAGSSGAMILEYVAQDALAQARSSVAAFAAGSAVISQGIEDDGSFAPQAVRGLGTAMDSFRTVLACELVAAVRALRLRGSPAPATPVGRAFEAAIEALPADLNDRSLGSDLAIARELLDTLFTTARLITDPDPRADHDSEERP